MYPSYILLTPDVGLMQTFIVQIGRVGLCAQRFVCTHNRVHLYTQSMDTGESPKVNWITEQESERLLSLLDLTPDLDKVLLALRSRLRGGDGKVVSCLGCVLN